MRLTVILMIIGMQVSAAAVSQTITYTGKNVGLEKVFQAVKKQTGYFIVYDKKLLQSTSPVTVSVQHVSLEGFMELVLKDQSLTYELKETTILIKKRPAPPAGLQSLLEISPPISIHGRITNENGEPLVASIVIKGTRKGTSSDEMGNFELKVNKGGIIVITAMSYEGRELQVADEPLYIILKKSVSLLDETKVIAYGTTSQRFNTGNVSTVSSEEIARQPVDNPLLALVGRVPGLLITQNNGIPGSGMSISIRGTNSINSGNDPMYVVDGVPYAAQLLPGQGYIMGQNNFGNSGSPFSYINPADIESISVLKDADATAIYGSRGANGVILITTKKGKAGPTHLDLTVQNGFGRVPRKAKLLNTSQYLEMRREALKNDGLTPSLDNGDFDLLLWDTTRYTDWQKTFIGNTAHYTDAQVAVSGGSDNTQFTIGAGYHRLTTVFMDNSADKKGSLHFSLVNASKDKRFNISLTGNYLFDDNRLPGIDLTRLALATAPNAPALFNADGSLNWAPSSTGTSTFNNPLSILYNSYQNRTNNLVANAILGYTLLPGLTVRSSFGYTNMQTNEQQLFPVAWLSPEDKLVAQSSATYVNNNMNSWVVEPQISYKKMVGAGNLEALIGSTIQENNGRGDQVSGVGYTSDLVLSNMAAAATLSSAGSTAYIYRYNALFGRVNYNWNNEWLIDLTARRDGSSRFGRNSQFHDFAAVGAGWVFSRSAFFTDRAKFISFGKLRASYGSTGNDQIGDYQFLSMYNPLYTGGGSYQGTGGLAPSRLTNPNLEWELTKKAEIALETGFFADRILLTTSYSRNRSSNQLLSYSLPYTTGFSGIARNFPATVQNTTWEFTMHGSIVQSRDFRWSTNLNLTIGRNKLASFPNLASSSYASYLVIGQPVYVSKAFHYEGVDPATGVYRFASKTDPVNPTYDDDQTVLINTLPKFYGGWQHTLTYKGFTLDLLFSFSTRKAYSDMFPSLPGMFNVNQLTTVLDRWRQPGDITDIQKFSSTYYNIYNQFSYKQGSDAAYIDVTYVKLKNASLSWQMPERWARSASIRSAKLFIQGQNLLTITNYKGLDPETVSNSTLPPLRIITFGIQMSL